MSCVAHGSLLVNVAEISTFPILIGSKVGLSVLPPCVIIPSAGSTFHDILYSPSSRLVSASKSIVLFIQTLFGDFVMSRVGSSSIVRSNTKTSDSHAVGVDPD